MDTEPLVAALTVVAIVAYLVVLYWAAVAYVAALQPGDRELAERWLVVVAGLLVLALVAVALGGDLARAVLVALAGYLIVRGPFARRRSA